MFGGISFGGASFAGVFVPHTTQTGTSGAGSGPALIFSPRVNWGAVEEAARRIAQRQSATVICGNQICSLVLSSSHVKGECNFELSSTTTATILSPTKVSASGRVRCESMSSKSVVSDNVVQTEENPTVEEINAILDVI